MANELAMTYQGDATLYAIIRRRSDAWVWDTAVNAFEPWSDDDLADYVSMLANRSGDMYQGDCPDSMAAGRYQIQYYRQNGEQASINDLLIGVEDIHWTGEAIAPLPTNESNAGDLVDLATVKRYLRFDDTSHDALLAVLITQVSQQIQKFCGRSFGLNWHRLRVKRLQKNVVFLKHHPVHAIERIATGCAEALRLKLEPEHTRGSVAMHNEKIHLTRTAANGMVINDEIPINEEYATTGMLADAITALEGWTAQTLVDVPTNELFPIALTSIDQTGLSMHFAPTMVNRFHLDQETGVLTLFERPEVGEIFIAYQAGYATVPADLQLIACELVAEAFRGSTHDRSLKSEKLGQYSATMRDTAAMCAAQATSLQPYMNIPLAAG